MGLHVRQVFDEFLEYGLEARRSVCYLVLDLDSMLGVKDVVEVSACDANGMNRIVCSLFCDPAALYRTSLGSTRMRASQQQGP
jgi:hypothetical protein